MQLDLIFGRPEPSAEYFQIGSQRIRISYQRHHRARRYVLRLQPNGSLRVTIPRRGSKREAAAVIQKHAAWVERQWRKFDSRAENPTHWLPGTPILFRGQSEILELTSTAQGMRVQFADQEIPLPSGARADLRPLVENHLRALALRELPRRTQELAAANGSTFQRVSVRNQRSRWGSCSARQTISLNWRLVQTPVFVRDYIIIHELMHLREMNHSPRFWKLVGEACPGFRDAEEWLRANQHLLR